MFTQKVEIQNEVKFYAQFSYVRSQIKLYIFLCFPVTCRDLHIQYKQKLEDPVSFQESLLEVIMMTA